MLSSVEPLLPGTGTLPICSLLAHPDHDRATVSGCQVVKDGFDRVPRHHADVHRPMLRGIGNPRRNGNSHCAAMPGDVVRMSGDAAPGDTSNPPAQVPLRTPQGETTTLVIRTIIASMVDMA